jgi:hypothetical protein
MEMSITSLLCWGYRHILKVALQHNYHTKIQTGNKKEIYSFSVL